LLLSESERRSRLILSDIDFSPIWRFFQDPRNHRVSEKLGHAEPENLYDSNEKVRAVFCLIERSHVRARKFAVDASRTAAPNARCWTGRNVRDRVGRRMFSVVQIYALVGIRMLRSRSTRAKRRIARRQADNTASLGACNTGSIGDTGVPHASIALPASRHRSSRK
jgi:hypothetical protein